MSPGAIAALVAASAGAGVMNALAGGGTILTFPTLVFLGMPAIRANATSAVALVPGAFASLAGYRREVETHRQWMGLALPSLVGGGAGSVLLLLTPERTFAALAPFLVLFATVLFGVQALLSRAAPAEPPLATPGRRALAWIAQLLVSVYGGYFGAGMGILMLVVLGFLGLRDIHAMNGLKNLFGVCINGVAAAWFVAQGAVDWPCALVMMGGATVGGYAGARLARRIGREKARAAVIGIGLLVTLLLFAAR